ncbi:hypothetical protein FOL47_010039 [Perkinsus chesapeaki]|uniref:Uncharacterized protein n=1 Tax=Perkinsus chesapeaki TaxID=330153 RepID=A0A7J6L538_PERCH|nr:hypothetical protein FOL47_010039 [Perkinsus chesapeaki]
MADKNDNRYGSAASTDKSSNLNNLFNVKITPPSSEEDGEQIQQNDLTIFGADASMLGETLRGRPAGYKPRRSSDSSVKSEVPKKKLKGTFSGVLVPTCENMWGVLIFLRFFYVVGNAGVGQACLAVVLSFIVAFCTTSCLSAIASSGGVVSEGGPYHMLSRSLGPYAGASVGITYYLGFALLGVLESVGAIDALVMAAPTLSTVPAYHQIFGGSLVLILNFVVWGGINIVTKLGVVFVVVVALTILMFYVGIFVSPQTEAAELAGVTGLSASTLGDNLGPSYDPGVRFGTVLAIIFPCFTGILSGANRADVLRNPQKSIRNGTFGAITISLFMYLSFMFFWGAVATSDYLKHGPPLGDAAHRRLSGVNNDEAGAIVGQIVWPHRIPAYVGIFISSVSQALQCFTVAPRLLQSISADNLLPILKPLSTLNRKGEPARALVITAILAIALSMIGDLDLIAPLLTMCFLVCYMFMNISCLMLTLLKTPTWRPAGIFRRRFRLWYIISSFVGVVASLAVMIIVSVYWTIGVLVLAALLYLYLDWVGAEAEWGSGLDGLRYNFALTALQGLQEKVHKRINWRPQVLVLYPVGNGCNSSENDNDGATAGTHDLLRFYGQMRKGRGMCVASAIVLDGDDKRVIAEKKRVAEVMAKESIQGFADVVVAPSFGEGASYAVQLAGIGGLRPNSVMLEWPSNWRRRSEEAREFVRLLQFATNTNKAVMCVKNLAYMPVGERAIPMNGTIDVWWMIHDGGFLLLCAHFLKQHKIWRGCQVRVLLVMEHADEEATATAKANLTKLLSNHRLLDGVIIEVVVLHDDAMIEPYTYDWTMKVTNRVDDLAASDMPFKRQNTLPTSLDDLFDGVLPVKTSAKAVGLPHHPSVEERRAAPVLRAFDEDLEWTSESDLLSNVHKKIEERRSYMDRLAQVNAFSSNSQSGNSTLKVPQTISGSNRRGSTVVHPNSARPYMRMNAIIAERSKDSALVMMNMPDIWSTESEKDCASYMAYCDCLTKSLDRVLLLHSTGLEVFTRF